MDVNAKIEQLKDKYNNLVKNHEGLYNKNYERNNNDIIKPDNDLHILIINIIKIFLRDIPLHSGNFDDENFQGSCDNCKNSSKPNALQYISKIKDLYEIIHNLTEIMNRDECEENRSFNQYTYCIRSHIIEILDNCNCNNGELKKFVDSTKASNEYNAYLQLINLRKDIINNLCDIISSQYYYYWNLTPPSERNTFSITMNEDFKTKFIQYENAILEYKSKYIPSESNSNMK